MGIKQELQEFKAVISRPANYGCGRRRRSHAQIRDQTEPPCRRCTDSSAQDNELFVCGLIAR